jgi:hypothetical protein
MTNKRKNTGISNSFLDNDVYFIHFYTMCSIFSTVKNNDIGLYEKENKFRITSFGDYEIKINRNHLNMNKHFLLYCFLLKKFESVNYSRNKDELLQSVKFDFDEIITFWNEEKFKTRLLNEFNVILDLFISTVFTIKCKDYTVKSGLISRAKINSDQTIEIFLTKDILEIFEVNKRQIFFNVIEFKKIKSGTAKKLYLFLLSYSKNKTTGYVVTSFKYSDIRQLIGFDIDHSIDNKTTRFREYDDNDSRRQIKKALDELYNIGFIKKIKTKAKQKVYDIFQIRHESKPKNKKSNDSVEVKDEADNISVSKSHANDVETLGLSESQLKQIKDTNDFLSNVKDPDDLDLSDESLEDIPFN